MVAAVGFTERAIVRPTDTAIFKILTPQVQAVATQLVSIAVAARMAVASFG